jgi:hypothetical protein
VCAGFYWPEPTVFHTNEKAGLSSWDRGTCAGIVGDRLVIGCDVTVMKEACVSMECQKACVFKAELYGQVGKDKTPNHRRHATCCFQSAASLNAIHG